MQGNVSNQLISTLEQFLNDILNNAVRMGQLNSNQSIGIRNAALGNLNALGNNLAQIHNGRIPTESAKKAVFELVNQIIGNMNNSMMNYQGGMGNQMMGMGNATVNLNNVASNQNMNNSILGQNMNTDMFNQNDTIGNILNITSSQSNKKIPVKNDNEIESSVNNVFLRKTKKNLPLSVINSGSPEKVEGFNIENINIGKLIREFKNTENGIVYTYFKSEYLIPEENDSKIIKNATKLFNKIFSSKRKVIFDIEYPEMFLMKNVDYDKMKEDYNNVKKIFLSKGFDEATKSLNGQSFVFSDIFKNILFNEINLMLKLFIRDQEDLETIFKITSLEDIQELLTLHRTSGYSFLEIDDFDGYMFNLINQIFDKYFGRKSKIFTIEEDIKHILFHQDIVIRDKDFIDRDFNKLDDPKFIKLLKNYALFGFKKRLIFTNMLPNAFIDVFENRNHDTYVFDNPSNALEGILVNEICSNLDASTRLVIEDNNKLRSYMIGKIINGNTIIIK